MISLILDDNLNWYLDLTFFILVTILKFVDHVSHLDNDVSAAAGHLSELLDQLFIVFTEKVVFLGEPL